MTHELPDVQAGFGKGRGTRDQIANIHWTMEKAREFQNDIYLYFIDYVLIPACVSSSPAFLMMYSAQKLNKQGDNIQP